MDMLVCVVDQAKGCCWTPGDPSIPWCYFSNGIILGYGVSSATKTSNGLEGSLQIVNGGAFYGADISPLHFAVRCVLDVARK
jgi:hypothetical protein